MPHEFVIGPLRTTKFAPGRARIYYCYRCEWTFLVFKNKVMVLDREGLPISREASLDRMRTFANGPCPVLETFASCGRLGVPPAKVIQIRALPRAQTTLEPNASRP
jgi:hypothetical protein